MDDMVIICSDQLPHDYTLIPPSAESDIFQDN